MAFRLKINKSVERAVQDVARQQIDRAIAEIDDSSIGRDDAIHQVRKRC